MEEKIVLKKKRPLSKKVAIGLYVCAGLSLAYGIFMVYYSITYVQSYYEDYGMSISEGIKDVVQYVISSSTSYIGFAILFFAAAMILMRMERLAGSQTAPETQEAGPELDEGETAEEPEEEPESVAEEKE